MIGNREMIQYHFTKQGKELNREIGKEIMVANAAIKYLEPIRRRPEKSCKEASKH